MTVLTRISSPAAAHSIAHRLREQAYASLRSAMSGQTRRSRRPATSSDRRPCIKLDGVVPEELALPLRVHPPVHHQRDRVGEVAFAMWVIRGVHQHVIADEIDDGVGQPGAFRNLDTLEIASTGNVPARLVPQLRKRGLDRFGMLIKPRHPKW